MITATNIFKSYNDLKILKGVNLEIQDSEIVSIMGKSGAGKSTLLHILGTLDKPDQGEIIINDTKITDKSDKEISKFRNEKLGFVFQFHHLLSEFTALENICIPAYIKGESKTNAEKKAKELLDLLQIIDRAEHKPAQLSGGEQQRIAIARALINDPLVLFADEPTGNLDYESSEEFHKLILKLNKEMNQTFVIVTHNQDLANLSHRILHMKDGVLF